MGEKPLYIGNRFVSILIDINTVKNWYPVHFNRLWCITVHGLCPSAMVHIFKIGLLHSSVFVQNSIGIFLTE